MFGIGMAKTPVSQRPKINKLVYFEVIKTVFQDCLYIRSQDGFFCSSISIKKIFIGYYYSFVLLEVYIDSFCSV